MYLSVLVGLLVQLNGILKCPNAVSITLWILNNEARRIRNGNRFWGLAPAVTKVVIQLSKSRQSFENQRIVSLKIRNDKNIFKILFFFKHQWSFMTAPEEVIPLRHYLKKGQQLVLWVRGGKKKKNPKEVLGCRSLFAPVLLLGHANRA